MKVKVLAACAAAIAFLHWAKSVDESNVVSLVATKAVDIIEFVVRLLLAA